MALLRTLLPLLAAGVLAGCSQQESLGHADFSLRDCAGCTAAPRHYHVQAFFDAQVSRHAPNGFYAYFELERPDGARGVLELDLPTDAAPNTPLAREDASYRELRDGRVVFEATGVQGSVQLPRSLMWEDAARCDCEDAMFELVFQAGDERRELSYGHLTRNEAVCGARLPARADPGLAVQVLDCSAPAPAMGAAPSDTDTRTTVVQTPGRSASSSRSCALSDCYPDDRAYTPVETGCGGSYYREDGCGGSSYEESSCGSSSAAQGGGCSSSSSDGCGSSSDRDRPRSSGCEGDTSDSPSSCSVARPAHGALRSFMGTGLPWTLVCLWQALRAARARRRAALRLRAPGSARP